MDFKFFILFLLIVFPALSQDTVKVEVTTKVVGAVTKVVISSKGNVVGELNSFI